jgi:hypothetical protein
MQINSMEIIMSRTKKIILLLTCIFLHSQNNLSASTENELENTNDILQKLASINNMDVQNINAVEDSSYSLLFNNFVNFKNFIVNNFSKSKFQKLCKEFIDQIYPEEDTDMIDFGTPVIIPESVITTTETTTVPIDTNSADTTSSISMNTNQSTDSFSLNDTAPSLDFSTTTTEITQTVTTEPEAEAVPTENLNPGEPE